MNKYIRSILLVVIILGFFVSLYFSQLFIKGVDFESSNFVLSKLLIALILVAIIIQMIAHSTRAKKSEILFSTIRENSFRTQFKYMSIGYFFNLLLPFRAGEFIRAYLLGKELSISKAVSFMAIVIERIFDAYIIAFSCFFIGYLYWGNNLFKTSFFLLAFWILITAVVLSVFILILYLQGKTTLKLIYKITDLFNDQIKDKSRLLMWSIIFGIHTIFNRLDYIKYLLLTLVMWFFYITSTFFLVFYFDKTQFLGKIILSMGSYVSVSFPSGPGYLGSYHYYFSQIAKEVTNNFETINILPIISWFVLMIPISLVGLFSVIILRRKVMTIKNKENDEFRYMKNKLYREEDISKELSGFLDAFFSCSEVTKIVHDQELKNKFKLVKSFRGGSNASTILVWEGKNLVVKKITLPQYSDKLKDQYEWLKKRQGKKNIPTVLKEEISSDYYSFNMEYKESYDTFFDYIHTEKIEKSKKILDLVLDFVYDEIYILGRRKYSNKEILTYIKKKIIDKVSDTKSINSKINELSNYDTLVINGDNYQNLNRIIKSIKNNKQVMDSLSGFYKTPIHGDLTVDNIIVDRKNVDFLLLDPNNENQIEDPIVDIGKMFQSLHSGYEFLIQMETIKIDNNYINFEENISAKYTELFNHFNTKVKKRLGCEEYKKIFFHEAVHYCRMLTYKAKINPETAPAFYAVAVKLLNQFYNQYEK